MLKETARFWIQNLLYVVKVKGKCSFLGDVVEDSCNRYATRFELWEGGDFSISCRKHHREPLRKAN